MAITFSGGVTVTGGATFIGSTPAANDPYFMYVPLLLESTSTNAQTNNTFLDSSTNNFTITRNGTPTQGSVTPYWPNGYWSNYFNGSTDYISVADNAALELGAGDFTLEGWFNFSSLPSTNGYQATLFSKWATSNASYEFYLYNSSGTYALYLTYSLNGSASTNLGPISFTPTLGAWYHIAVCRSSTNIIFYVNGTQQGSTQTLSGTIFDGSGSLSIGNFNAQANTYFNGYVSNARVVKGVAVYTGTFTPPTLPLAATQSSGTNIAAITGTATGLLTCQSNRFCDNSTNNFAITVNGTPKVQAFQPFSPTASYTAAAYGGSGYLPGSASDYLSVADNAAFNLSSTSWTIEAWVYPTARTATYSSWIVGKRNIPSPYTWVWGIGINSTGYPEFYGTSATMTASILAPLNAWTHIAAVSNGSTVTLYVNGAVGVGPTSYTISSNAASVTIGNYSVDNPFFTGYISNLRIVKGTAVYTAAFTPPAAPVTAVSGTSLLFNCTNAGIYDAAVQNNQITVGSAQASTTVAKWSPTSMKFNGTTDRLTIPYNKAFSLTSQNFTIEFWIYFNSVASGQTIARQDSNATQKNWALYTGSTGTLSYYLSSNGSSYDIANGISIGSVAINTWYYVALVRNGSVFTPYLNGTAGTTTTSSASLFASTADMSIGSNPTSIEWFNGYIQDFRITNGVARTITTPTEAFPTQ